MPKPCVWGWTTLSLLGVLLSSLACESGARLGASPATPRSPPSQTVAPEPVPVPAPVNALELESVSQTTLAEPFDVGFAHPCIVRSSETNEYMVSVIGFMRVEGYRLRIKYDDYLARDLELPETGEGQLVPLATLMDEWGRVSEGHHRVSVFAVSSQDGRVPKTPTAQPALASCELKADPSGVVAALPVGSFSSDVVLLGPEGTYNGAASVAALQAQLFVPSGPHAVNLWIDRPDGGRDQHTVKAGVFLIKGATNGDYRLSASLAPSGSLTPVGQGPVHTITVNLDEP